LITTRRWYKPQSLWRMLSTTRVIRLPT